MTSIIPPIDKFDRPFVETSVNIAFDDLSSVQIKFVDEGVGTFAIIKAEKWRVDPDELIRIARWVKRACGEIDKFHARPEVKQNGEAK